MTPDAALFDPEAINLSIGPYALGFRDHLVRASHGHSPLCAFATADGECALMVLTGYHSSRCVGIHAEMREVVRSGEVAAFNSRITKIRGPTVQAAPMRTEIDLHLSAVRYSGLGAKGKRSRLAPGAFGRPIRPRVAARVRAERR